VGRAIKRARRRAVAHAVRGLAALLGRLPRSLALALGRGLGALGFLLARGPRRRAVRQLAEALALRGPAAWRLAARAFLEVGANAVETLRLPRERAHLAERVHLSPAARAVLAAARAEGRGVLFVTAHLGAWELLAQRIALEIQPAATLARRAPNPHLGAFLERLRAEGGLATINRGDPGAARAVLATLKQGGVLGALIDQDTRVESGHVPFFGRPAATPTGPAALAVRRGLPVVTGFVRREGDRHVIAVERVPLPPEGPGAALALTAELTARIEAAVRADPAAWVWFHDRWRTPPPALDPGEPAG
jgi:KDO2-lipid IV(A) lauroyltransferase